MRRASTCLALLGLVVLSLTGVASAAPTMTLVAKAVPIPGFPGTGNILGAGAAVEAKYTIHGTESTGGVPSQITHVNFFLPAGTKINQTGFVTCPTATLENIGPERLPHEVPGQPRRFRGRRRSDRRRTRQRERHPAGVLRARRRPAVLRQCRLADLGAAARRQGALHPGRAPVRPGVHDRSPAGPVGPRRPAGVDRIDQHQGRRRLQEGQEDDLLRHAADKVQRRPPGEVRSHVRHRRNVDGHVQGALPQEVSLD